jgi:hypothetical protein
VLSLSIGVALTTLWSYLVERFREPYDDKLVDYTKGYAIASGVISTYMILPSVMLAIFVRERPPDSSKKVPHLNVFKGVLIALKNFPFLMVMLVWRVCYA